MSHLVFVYGTLKRGYHNHIILSRSQFVQEVRTRPCYRLYDCGPFPCMVEVKQDGISIVGELYSVDDQVLRRLDILEGAPSLYQRLPIQLEDFDGNAVAYFYQNDVSEFIDCGSSWPRQCTT